MNAREYTATEHLRDGRAIEIRALQPSDREGRLAYMARTSDDARYRRFLTPTRSFDEQTIDFYVNVDFVRHVAITAVLHDGAEAVGLGGARYIVTEPGCASIAFLVGDAHQGLGIGTRLRHHLILIARDSGLARLTAEVLADNTPMLKVFERCGLPMAKRREPGLIRIAMDL
ncbi:MAG: GNAT family N-acetyltransferase [Rubrivivax sp.]